MDLMVSFSYLSKFRFIYYFHLIQDGKSAKGWRRDRAL